MSRMFESYWRSSIDACAGPKEKEEDEDCPGGTPEVPVEHFVWEAVQGRSCDFWERPHKFSNSRPCFTCESAEALRSADSQACILAETRAWVSCGFFQLSACASMEAKLLWVPGEERGVEVALLYCGA